MKEKNTKKTKVEQAIDKAAAVVPSGNPHPTGQSIIIQGTDYEKLVVLVGDLKQSIITAGDKYLSLCKHIREKQIPPRVVTELMLKEGFHKTRISEVNRVSQCGDDVWDEFEAKALSFRKVLLLERGTGPENVADAGDAIEIGGEVSEGSASEKEIDPEDRKRMSIEKMSRAAKQLLHLGADLELRSKKWTIGNGYELRLVRQTKAEAEKSVLANKAGGGVEE
jgi:hypothetical protein